MKYTAEEVRAHARMLRECRINADTTRDRQQDKLADICDAYADLLERIKANEGANDRIDFKGMWNAMSDRAYAHPPAQTAQSELVDCPECGSRCTYRAISMSDDVIYEYTPAQAAQHPDDVAVDAFAEAMKAKLAEARAKGRGGWQDKDDCPQQRLSDMLRVHVEKGDPRDVANFCMFLHQRGEAILPAEPVAQGEMGKEIEYSLWGLIHNGKVAGDPRQGAVDWHMRILIRQMVPHLIELAKLKGIRSQFDAATPAHPTQPAQSVDIEAIREVIESHINEAKKLRHDPESQNYLYEQADKLEAALQEKGNG